ncbi:MAG: class I SAM-dependent methyltransferase [Candidatus Woesearchaeota archaeon]|jgi:ubiquinone/menaquinone biosynthesis C-methylase UbiE
MDKAQEKFYKRNSEKFKKYEFQSGGKIISGESPNFIDYLKTFSNKEFKVLDLGCGSGELTLKLASYFKEIIGIDPFKEYINSALRQKNELNISNVNFIVADGKNMPFKSDFFDIIISSRGPLSADLEFMTESYRVLKKGGLMIEETIGEQDKLELKKIFGRGQNYPISLTKLDSVKKLLLKLNLLLINYNYFLYYQEYSSIDAVLELLERAPIIPDFDVIKDKNKINNIEKELGVTNIKLSNHRLHWFARK